MPMTNHQLGCVIYVQDPLPRFQPARLRWKLQQKFSHFDWASSYAAQPVWIYFCARLWQVECWNSVGFHYSSAIYKSKLLLSVKQDNCLEILTCYEILAGEMSRTDFFVLITGKRYEFRPFVEEFAGGPWYGKEPSSRLDFFMLASWYDALHTCYCIRFKTGRENYVTSTMFFDENYTDMFQ